MATAGPRRRRSDAATPRPLPFGPTPGAIGPADPDGASRSVAHALEAVRRHRRPVTLVALELPRARDERDLERAASLVRRTVRDTDGLWRDGVASMLLILTDVDGPGSEPALARLRLRLRSEGLGDLRMGRAAPPPGIGAGELVALARADCRPISRSRPSA